MTDYEKVIVVLSKGYKDKAENFKGGVGNEYNLILKYIETQKNKYILISFEPISDEITPLNFKGRHIFDLSNKKNLNETNNATEETESIEIPYALDSVFSVSLKAIGLALEMITVSGA